MDTLSISQRLRLSNRLHQYCLQEERVRTQDLENERTYQKERYVCRLVCLFFLIQARKYMLIDFDQTQFLPKNLRGRLP